MSLNDGKKQTTQSELQRKIKRNKMIWTTVKIVAFIVFMYAVITIGGK